jgi:predicted Zn-dependent protease
MTASPAARRSFAGGNLFMSSLPPPDHHHFSAAVGWLELGNPAEAQAELARLDPAHHKHPEVLMVRWQIQAARHDWEAAIKTAQTLTQVAAEEAWGWVHLAFALHELKRTDEAWNTLHPIAARFPQDFLIRYNLACYACQLGRTTVAEDWLQQAAAIAGRAPIAQMAQDDPDLAPLAARLKHLLK